MIEFNLLQLLVSFYPSDGVDCLLLEFVVAQIDLIKDPVELLHSHEHAVLQICGGYLWLLGQEGALVTHRIRRRRPHLTLVVRGLSLLLLAGTTWSPTHPLALLLLNLLTLFSDRQVAPLVADRANLADIEVPLLLSEAARVELVVPRHALEQNERLCDLRTYDLTIALLTDSVRLEPVLSSRRLADDFLDWLNTEAHALVGDKNTND